MTLRGKHNQPAGTKSAKATKHVPTHGGPQTGNGFTAQGRKPKAAEIKTRGTAPGSESRLRLPKWLGGN
jgi:hypothetical protein